MPPPSIPQGVLSIKAFGNVSKWETDKRNGSHQKSTALLTATGKPSHMLCLIIISLLMADAFSGTTRRKHFPPPDPRFPGWAAIMTGCKVRGVLKRLPAFLERKATLLKEWDRILSRWEQCRPPPPQLSFSR